MRISIPPSNFIMGEPLIINLVNDPLVDVLEIDTAVGLYLEKFKNIVLTKITNQIRSIKNA